MSRLEKKCVLASVVLHGLLLLVVAFGAAFKGKPQPLPQYTIKVIPDIFRDGPPGGGGNPNVARTDDQVKGNTTAPVPPAHDTSPAPKPPETPTRPAPPPPAPTRPTQAQPTPVRPTPARTTTPTPPVKPTTTAKAPPKPAPTIKDLLVDTVRAPDRAAKDKADAQAREAARQRAAADKALANQVGSIASGLKRGFEKGTAAEVWGTGGVAYAPYASYIQSLYDSAWKVQPDLASENFVVPVEIVIARDGRLVSQRILRKSGNASMDRSVQRCLDEVKARWFPRPFPADTRDAEKTFQIDFNLKAKQLVG